MKTSPRDSAKCVLAAIFLFAAFSTNALGHCDSLDGPVIKDAQRSIERNDIAPVLKWVSADEEPELTRVFERTMEIRATSPEVQQVADSYFLETLVRIHRKSEGEGFTGLKPAGSVEPPIAAADKALANGDVEELAATISAAVREAVVERFQHAYEAKQEAEITTAQGRDFVTAYVQFTHFVEAIHHLVSHGAEHKHRAQDDQQASP